MLRPFYMIMKDVNLPDMWGRELLLRTLIKGKLLYPFQITLQMNESTRWGISYVGNLFIGIGCKQDW